MAKIDLTFLGCKYQMINVMRWFSLKTDGVTKSVGVSLTFN
jgi:hypothetical protein